MATKRRKLDGRDASHVAEMTQSHGWLTVRDRIKQTREDFARELEQQGTGWERTNFVRGMITGLDLMLSIPDILIGEAKRLQPADPGERTL